MNFHLVEQQDTIAPRYELRDFFQNPQRSAYALSDDGSMIGFLQPINVGHATRLNVFVQTLDQGKPVGPPSKSPMKPNAMSMVFFGKVLIPLSMPKTLTVMKIIMCSLWMRKPEKAKT